jgi:polysaccharide export outer membrane protein
MKLPLNWIAMFATISSYAAGTEAPVLNASSPNTAAVSIQSAQYVIGARDMLQVDVFDVPALSGAMQVDSTGHINVPLIGQVAASGRTPNQLSQDIATALNAKYMKDPIVTVTVKDAASKTVTVDGSVTQPGLYQIGGATTLMQAVAMAHGPDQVADVHHVALIRTTEQGRSVSVFDLEEIRDGKTIDPAVHADDVIVVDSSGTRKFVRDFGSVISVLGWLHP